MLANQTGLSSKVVSERHHRASQHENKMTAGQAATELRKQGFQIKARELVKAWELLTGREPEWHHSGFYKSTSGSRMGRTFFFTTEQVQEVAERFSEIQELQARQEEKEQKTVKGFFYVWDHDYSGKYGRKTNFKILQIYEGSAERTPRNFTEVTDQIIFENVKLEEGKKYYGWDEPTISEFTF